MRHYDPGVAVADDPPPVVIQERRHAPDRRTGWRGGRRDHDWLTRPLHGWSRHTVGSRFRLLRRLRRKAD